MPQMLGHIALVVRNYDEALAFYTQVLGFELIEDSDLGGGKRWVLVTPPGAMLSVPLPVMGPPVSPAPLAMLVTVPTLGKV